jgi:hypothetical protein
MHGVFRRSSKVTLALFALFCWSTLARAEEPGAEFEKIEPGRTLVISAPIGTSPDVLGMGFDEHFSDTDATGKTLRIYPSKARHVAENQYFAQFEMLDNAFKLNAHAHLLTAAMGASVSAEKRYMVLKVYSLQATETLISEGEPLAAAPLVAQRLYLGWAMNVVFEGDASTFTAEVAADLMRRGAGIDVMVKRYNLRKYVHLVGLEPKVKGSIPVVLDEAQISDSFEVSPQPMPIFVEYKVGKDFFSPKISWQRGGFKPGQYRLTTVRYSVAKTKVDGKHWDALGGFPDPFLTISIDGAQVQTCSDKDQFEGSCVSQKVVELTERSTTELTAVDKDIKEDDPIGTVPPTNIFAAGRPYAEIDLPTTGQLQRIAVTFVPLAGTSVAQTAPASP